MDFEKEKLELEKQKFIFEKDIRLKELKTKINWYSNPLVVGIFIGVIALIGNSINTSINNKNQIVLDQRKFQTELILTAVDSDNENQNRENLKFLVDLGLIEKDFANLGNVMKDSIIPIKFHLNQNKYMKIVAAKTDLVTYNSPQDGAVAMYHIKMNDILLVKSETELWYNVDSENKNLGWVTKNKTNILFDF